MPGELDTTFSSDGLLQTGLRHQNNLDPRSGDNEGFWSEHPQSLAFHDNQIWTLARVGSSQDNIIARYSVDGSLVEPTINGIDGNNSPEEFLIDSSGRILVNSFNSIERYLPDGTLDLDFGQSGRFDLNENFSASDFLIDELNDDDYDIVIASRGANSTSLIRLNSDGSLDSSTTTDWDNRSPLNIAVSLDPSSENSNGNNRIVVGSSLNRNAEGIARYSANALALDATFGDSSTPGQVLLNTVTTQSVAARLANLAVASDGSIIISGGDPFFNFDNASPNATVRRLTSNGQIDIGFGRIDVGGVPDLDGTTVFNFSNSSVDLDVGLTVALDSQERIIVGGATGIARLDSNGYLDSTFAENGIVENALGSDASNAYVTDLIIDPSGNIVVQGRADSTSSEFSGAELILARYTGGGDVIEPPSSSLEQDFNQDGFEDLLWTQVSRNTVRAAFWSIQDIGSQPDDIAVGFLDSGNTLPSDWEAVGTYDFDNNGTADIVWRRANSFQSAVWFMDGTERQSSAFLAPTNPVDDNQASQWQMEDAADFNGDGEAEILWRNTSTGQVAIWQLDGLNFQSAQFADLTNIGQGTTGLLSTNWQFGATGDFNSDGRDDILWRNTETGQNAVWLLDGNEVIGSTFTNSLPNTDWEIIGAGDYSGDGQTDIAWRNGSANAIWTMNYDEQSGLTRTSSSFIPVLNTSWTGIS